MITEEFVTIATRISALKGHASLRRLVLPYPLETRPEDECREIAREYYPQVARDPRRDGVSVKA